jgi:hypothetical protein
MFAALATACALVASSAALVLRSGGFWDSSQSLGAWSQRVARQARLPEALRAALTGEEGVMGQRAMGAPAPMPGPTKQIR